MDFYQLGYYRLGKQGVDAGWSVVSPSNGMSAIAIKGFKGIAAKLAGLKETSDFPTRGMGIFEYENFIYLIHTNYEAEGEDTRGVSYTHGYVINRENYYELCKTPERLFGIELSAFPMEYDSSIKAYPVADSLPYQSLQVVDLLNKYGLDQVSYRKLLLAAICSVSENDSRLTIKCDCDSQECLGVYREIMYLIMCGMPYHLRTRINTFSFSGSGAKICVSNNYSGGNYFDLNTKETNCNFERVMNYRFTMLYNSYMAGDKNLDIILLNIADFTQEAFDNALDSPNCEQVEAAFHRLQKKTEETDDVVSMLSNFLALHPTTSPVVEEYLTFLLSEIITRQISIESEDINNQLYSRSVETGNESLKNAFIRYSYLRLVLSGADAVPQKMWELYTSKSVFYYDILELLKIYNSDLYERYIVDKYLPSVMSTMSSAKRYLEGAPAEMQNPVFCEEIVKLLWKLSARSMGAYNDFASLSYEKAGIESCLELIPESMYSKEGFEKKLVELFWEQFDINTFRTEQSGEIVLEAQEVSTYDKARMLMELTEYVRMPGVDFQVPYTVIVKEAYFTDDIALNDFKSFVKRKVLPFVRLDTSAIFDICLMCYYGSGGNRFDVVEWAFRIIREEKPNILESHRLKGMLISSKVLQDVRCRRAFTESLESAYKNRSEVKRECGAPTVKGLKRCLDIMTNKDEVSNDGEGNFLFSLHRMLIGLTAFMSMGFVIRSIWKYYFPEKVYVPILVFAITVLIIVAVMIVKQLLKRDGVSEILESMGTSEVLNFSLFVLTAFLVVALAVLFVVVIHIFWFGVAYLAFCVLVCAIMTVIYCFFSGRD